jgi:hypothetical protein
MTNCKTALGFKDVPNANLPKTARNAINKCTTRQLDPTRPKTYREIEEECMEMFPLGNEGLTTARKESLKGCMRFALRRGGARRTRRHRIHKKRRTTRRR